MDAKQDTAPIWLFSIAATATFLTLVCMMHLASCEGSSAIRVVSKPKSRPTRGPRPQTPPPRLARVEKPKLPDSPIDELFEQEFSAPSIALTFPLAGLEDKGGYDPVANLGPLDLLKPIELGAETELPSDLAHLVLHPGVLQVEAADLLVLRPAAPRWDAHSYERRWNLFGLSSPSITAAVGRLLADASNQGHTRTAEIIDATRTLAKASTASQRLTGVIHSPPALAGPIVESPTDRLAMTSPRQASSLDNVVPDDRALNESNTLATPKTLLEQVRLLLAEPATSTWALEVETALDAALAVRPGDAEGFTRVGQKLRRLALEGSDMAELVDSQRAAVLLRRACYGLFRRLAAWDLTVQLESRDLRTTNQLAIRSESLAKSSTYRSSNTAPRWRSISDNLLTRRQDALNVSLSAASPNRRAHVLKAVSFEQTIKQEAQRGLDGRWLISRIEDYESGRSPRLASTIAQDVESLRSSKNPIEQELGDHFDRQYRNANVRLAIADELVNRLLPKSTKSKNRINDQLRGARVEGIATTNTRLVLRLTPNDTSWKIGVEAQGSVATQTNSSSGPVVLRSHGVTKFVANKPIEVDHAGVRSSAAQCEANNHTRLVRVDSRLDGVPVVRRVVRTRAQDEFVASQAAVRKHAERRVEQSVARELDTRTSKAIGEIERLYQDELVSRVEALGMAVQPIEVRTTENRLIARLRLAGDGQLGSHTPRTRAPSDSLASLQLHESAINNAAAGLGLAGQRFTPEQLRTHLATLLRSPDLAEGEIDTPLAEFVFAKEQPISVHLDQGEAQIVLAFAELRLGKKCYRDFRVHASYQPEPIGAAAIVRRTGPIEIEGRLKSSGRLRLHGVFGKVLSEKRPITLLAPPAGDDRFDDLMITQMVLADGWLGLAVGPAKHPAIRGERVAIAGRYLR